MSLTLSRPKHSRSRPAKSSPAPSGPRARRVRRVVRKIDGWTVLKVSILFYASLLLVVLVAGMVLWVVASVTGVMHNIDTFIAKLFALQSFHFRVAQVLQGTLAGGAVLVVLGTVLNVVMAVLYNLISDVVGGVEISVLEEEPTR